MRRKHVCPGLSAGTMDGNVEGAPAYGGVRQVWSVVRPLLAEAKIVLDVGGGNEEVRTPGAMCWDLGYGFDARRLDLLGENTTELVIISHFLEHLFPVDAEGVLQESYRVLKSGGKLFITCPHECSSQWSCLLNEEIREHHLWAPSCAEIESILRRIGFRILKVDPHVCNIHSWWLLAQK